MEQGVWRSRGGDSITSGVRVLTQAATGRLQRSLLTAPQAPSSAFHGRRRNKAIHVAGQSQRWWRRPMASTFVVDSLTDAEQMEIVREQYWRRRYWDFLEWPRLAQAIYALVYPTGAGKYFHT